MIFNNIEILIFVLSLLLLVFLYLFFFKGRIVLIKKPCIGVIVRNNKFLRNVYSGFAILLPFIDKLYFVDIEEKNICLSQSSFTKDNKNLNITIELSYSINNPEKTILYTPTVVDEVEDIIKNSLDNLINELTSEVIIEKKDFFSEKLLDFINNKTNDFGVTFSRAQVKNVSLRVF